MSGSELDAILENVETVASMETERAIYPRLKRFLRMVVRTCLPHPMASTDASLLGLAPKLAARLHQQAGKRPKCLHSDACPGGIMLRRFLAVGGERFVMMKSALLVGLALHAGACARINSPDQQVTPPVNANPDTGQSHSIPSEELDYTPVDGALYLGTQCPIGSFAEPDAVKAALWDCNSPVMSRFRILEPAPTVLFQADCRKRLLTVRIKELELDLTWQVLPDGRFSIPVEKSPKITLDADATGNGPCVAATRLTLSGTLQCEDVDHPEILVDSVWLLNPPPLPIPSPSPSVLPSPTPVLSPTPLPSSSPLPMPSPQPSSQPSSAPSGGTVILEAFSGTSLFQACHFEESCLLHAPHRLKQCR